LTPTGNFSTESPFQPFVVYCFVILFIFCYDSVNAVANKKSTQHRRITDIKARKIKYRQIYWWTKAKIHFTGAVRVHFIAIDKAEAVR